MSGDSLPLPLPLARFAADSCEATTLYRELRKPLLRYLVCLGLSADEAQDVVQDAFVSLHRHLGSGGWQEKFRLLGKATLLSTASERECLLLRAGGLRYREIAEVLGIPTSTVSDTVDRAIKKLAEK